MNYDNNQGYIVVRDYLPSFAIQQFKLWAMNPENIHRGNACDGKYYDTFGNKEIITDSEFERKYLKIVSIVVSKFIKLTF